jgi:hypothetical protein
MLFRMISPRVSKSRSIITRKGIPKDARAEYQRLYGQRWEAKLTLPAGTKPHEVKVRISEFTATVETQIAAIRAAQRGEGQSLTQRQTLALAGEWYAWYVARHEENPGTVEHWRVMWDVLVSRLEDYAPDWVIEDGWRDLEWTREPEVRAGIRPLIADEAKTTQFLASKGVVLNAEAQAAFLDCVLDEFMAAILLLTRRANKDYSPDTRPSEFPKFDGRKIVRPTGKTSPWQLFEAWLKARQPAASGVNRWRCVFLDLEQRFESATDITEDEAREWSRQLGTTKRKARTVNDVWITAARTVFAWAQEERLITSNPFKDVRVTEPRRIKHRETDAFMPVEWRTILSAASAIGTPKTIFQGAQRWVPWLCAYSGARPGEITQLRGVDVQSRGHVTAFIALPPAVPLTTLGLRQIVLVGDAHGCGHQCDGMGCLAGSWWSSNDELLRLCIRRQIGERQHASFKDAPADFAVDAGGELTELTTDAFYLGHRHGVSGSQLFSTSIVCLGDRRGQAECFVRPSNQLVQIQLLSGHDVSRSGHHSRFVAADEGIARVVGIDPR